MQESLETQDFIKNINGFFYDLGQEWIFIHSKLLCDRNYLVTQAHQQIKQWLGVFHSTEIWRLNFFSSRLAVFQTVLFMV